MAIERIVANLTVADPSATVREHSQILGLDVVMDHGWIVTLADSNGHQLSLISRDATATTDPVISVFVDDITAAYATALACGVEIVHPLTTEEWGVRRFFYRDSAGNVVNVGTQGGTRRLVHRGGTDRARQQLSHGGSVVTGPHGAKVTRK